VYFKADSLNVSKYTLKFPSPTGLALNTAYPLDRELGPQSSEPRQIPVSAVLGHKV